MQPQGTYPLPGQASNKKIGLMVLVILLVLSLAFGAWALSSRGSYKKIAEDDAATARSAVAKQAQLQTQYDTLSKQPYKTYKSDSTFGSISFNYPKNWAAYVDETGSIEPIDGWFYPDQVPGTQGKPAFALRLELVNTAYSDVLDSFSSAIHDGTAKASAYIPPKLHGVANVQAGTKINGVVDQDNNFKGSMVIMKVRDKTLQIYTQSNTYLSDFSNTVLSSLTFVP